MLTREEFTTLPESKEHKFYDTGGVDVEASPQANKTSLEVGNSVDDYSMDEIWKDIEFSEDGYKRTLPRGDLFPIESLNEWSMNEEVSNMSIRFQ